MITPAPVLEAPGKQTGGPAWMALALLSAIYAINFVDRQILSIPADDVKAEFKLSDSDLGFLYGTAFGVFYALFGIPLGRLADGWHRVRLIAVGLSLWSVMTAVSGFVRSGGSLAAARVGVGVGEATPAPSAISLLSDRFPLTTRALALGIFSSGAYIGSGISLGLGGWIVEQWNAGHPVPADAPFGLAGWRVAFIAVGALGLLLALLVCLLREPTRRHDAGVDAEPLRAFLREATGIVPPFTLIAISRLGAGALIANLAFALGFAGTVWLLAAIGESAQLWAALGVGIYAAVSWAMVLRRRDPEVHAAIFKAPAFWRRCWPVGSMPRWSVRSASGRSPMPCASSNCRARVSVCWSAECWRWRALLASSSADGWATGSAPSIPRGESA